MNEFEGYLFSTGEEDEEYGLYIMEIDCDLHQDDFYLMYYFDGDTFIHRQEEYKKLFKPSSEIPLCKDDIGNEYTGEKLNTYLSECLNAYKEEYPGYLKYFNDTKEKFNDLE